MRLGCKRAIVAVARRVLRAIHAMPRDGKAHAGPGIDCGKVAVGRKSARRLRKLQEYGHVEGVRIEQERRHDTRAA